MAGRRALRRRAAMTDQLFVHFQLGKNRCVSLYDGYHNYALAQMMANVPQDEVEAFLRARGLPADFISTPFTSLCVDMGESFVLVDPGAANLLPTTGKLLQSMHSAGIAPESIGAIFLTHAHPDHVGGVTDESGQPAFANATLYIWKVEWDFWFSDEAVAKTGWMTDFVRPRLAAYKDKTVQLEREGEVLPGLDVLFAPGHTPGHMVVSFANQEERLMFVGDTVLTEHHLERPDWLPTFDLLPEAAAASKRKVFDLAASSQCWVMGQQFSPFPSLGHVVSSEPGWKWQPGRFA
jgi:glyoxylase-like metal-dependent hydrolase (beta-lactamase superfamily II)